MLDLLSIDPGTRALGWASWEARGLVACGRSIAAKSVRGNAALAACHVARIGGHYERAALEQMRWRSGDARSQPNDLIAVATVGALVAGRLSSRVRLLPADHWKGGVPKPIHHRRMIAALDPYELAIVEAALSGTLAKPKGHDKETLDAIGLGLYDLQRINKAGVARA